MAPSVDSLITSLKGFPSFDTDKWIEQLYHCTRNVSDIAFIERSLGPLLAQEKIIDGTHLRSDAGQSLMTSLAQSSTATSISQLPSDKDQYGFRNCIDGAKAKQFKTDSICRLTAMCYADHVDQQLTQKGFPALKSLAADNDFCKAFKAKLEDSQTFTDAIWDDVGKGNTVFSSTLLFMANYFQNELSPPLHSPSEVWNYDYGTVAAKWLSMAADKPDGVTKMTLVVAKTLPINFALQQSNAFSPPSKTDAIEPIKAMQPQDDKMKKAIEYAKSLTGVELGDWHAYTHMLDSLWDSKESNYNDAISSAAQMSDAHYDQPPRMTLGDDYGPPAGTLTTIIGQGVADWINRARSNSSWSQFVTNGAPRNWNVTVPSPFGACFLPDTEILGRDGNIPIQDLKENDWLLTRGGFNEWGLVSDEKVVVPVKNPIIHGINNETPFFTAGHVFHTTTGLRALNPDLAIKENPWCNVGRLAVGHVLLRLAQDSTGYAQVIVERITSVERPDVNKVYGVHLREGRRSYHANRFLVAVNYPEFTMKSICKALTTLPQDKQVKMLRAIEELKPLFERFGISTMSEVLQREMETEINSPTSMRMYTVTESALTSVSHCSAVYYPEAVKGADYSELRGKLPLVTVVEGVVSVHGDVCERAEIDPKTNSVIWSRSMDDAEGTFEHGILIVNPKNLSAIGRIHYSRDLHAEDMITTNPLHFVALGTGANSAILSTTFANTTVAYAESVPDGVSISSASTTTTTVQIRNLVAESVQEAESRSDAPKFLIEDSQRGLVATGEVEPALELKSFSMMAAAPPKMEMQTSAISAAPATAVDANPNVVPGNPIPLLPPMRYKMIYDDTTFKDGQVQPKAPLTFGNMDLVLGRRNANGVPTNFLSIPDLDELLLLINSKGLQGQEKLLCLYESATNSLDDGRYQGTLRLPTDTISFLGTIKDGTAEDDMSLNWTFKTNLQTDISIPLIWTNIDITIGADRKTAIGTITEYNPGTTTMQGHKHLFMSNPGELASPAITVPRQETSTSAGQIPTGTPTQPPSVPQKPPTPPPRQGQYAPFHVQVLHSIDYQDSAVQSKAKAILQTVMYYHMNPDDRGKVLNKNPPETLPDALADKLDSGLKTWIKDVYAPAFTCLLITESYDTKDWQIKFTDEEKAKVQYFWQGSGKKCLNQSLEYKQINQLCVRQAMLALYRNPLAQFVDDDGPGWARQLYDEAKANDMEAMIAKPVNNRDNMVNKFCNILYVLDPNTLYAQELYRDVRNKYYAIILGAPADEKLSDDATWLPDLVSWLTDVLMSPDRTDITPELKETLFSEMEALAKSRNEQFQRTAKDTVAKTLTDSIRMAATTSGGLAGLKVVGTGLWLAPTNGWSGLQNAAITENAKTYTSTGSNLGTLGKGLMLAATVVGLFVTRPDLTPSEMGKIAVDTSRQVLDILTPFVVRKEAKTVLQIASERQLMNQKLSARGRYGPLVNDTVEHAMDLAAKEALQINQDAAAAAARPGFWSRAKSKFKISAGFARILSLALGIVMTAFMIWDLCGNFNKLTTAGQVLAILQIVLEFSMVVVAVLEIAFSFSWVPIVGQLLLIASAVVAIFILVWGQPKPEPSEAEKFVQRMKDGWVKGLDSPPSQLLTYTAQPASGFSSPILAVEVTAKNNTGKDIELIQVTSDLAEGDPSTTQLGSATLIFSGGSEAPCLFSNLSFVASRSSDPKLKSSDVGECRLDQSKEYFVQKVVTPDGTNTRDTTYNYRVEFQPKPGSSTPAVLKAGESFKMTVVGNVATAGTSTLKLTEARPGAPACPSVFTFARNQSGGTFSLSKQ